jgi:hypothetical protein
VIRILHTFNIPAWVDDKAFLLGAVPNQITDVLHLTCPTTTKSIPKLIGSNPDMEDWTSHH